jgi:hypothetical protein
VAKGKRSTIDMQWGVPYGTPILRSTRATHQRPSLFASPDVGAATLSTRATGLLASASDPT